MNKFLFLILVFIVVPILNGFGQCCSAGNPMGADGTISGMKKNEMQLYTSYKHSLSTEYYHLSSPTADQHIKRSYYNYQNLALTYGVLERLSLEAEMGYFYNKVQESYNNDSEETSIGANGLGDLAINVRFIPIKTINPLAILIISGGLKIPIGDFQEEVDGAQLPISLQPSSGAFKYSGSLFYSLKPAGSKLGLNTLALMEISSTIKEGYLVYKYGHYFQLGIAGTYLITKNFRIVLNTDFEWRTPDKREDEMTVPSTGNKVIYLNPQVNYSFVNDWGIIAMAYFPVYKYVNGDQLTNQYSFLIGVRKNIQL